MAYLWIVLGLLLACTFSAPDAEASWLDLIATCAIPLSFLAVAYGLATKKRMWPFVSLGVSLSLSLLYLWAVFAGGMARRIWFKGIVRYCLDNWEYICVYLRFGDWTELFNLLFMNVFFPVLAMLTILVNSADLAKNRKIRRSDNVSRKSGAGEASG